MEIEDELLTPQRDASPDLLIGRLSAAELSNWKLDADMVVLSACQTGLGQPAGGEGYLGFSQALFLAGARSVVLSLWRVDDEATSLLMVRFYENLLGKRSGLKAPLSKVVHVFWFLFFFVYGWGWGKGRRPVP